VPRIDTYSGNVEGLRFDHARQPLLGHRADRDSGARGIDVGSGLDGRGKGVETVLGVDLAGGVAGVFLAGVVAVPPPPLTLRTLRDVRQVIASMPRDDLGVPRRSSSSNRKEAANDNQRQ
jgi:hypothetical protein